MNWMKSYIKVFDLRQKYPRMSFSLLMFSSALPVPRRLSFSTHPEVAHYVDIKGFLNELVRGFQEVLPCHDTCIVDEDVHLAGEQTG